MVKRDCAAEESRVTKKKKWKRRERDLSGDCSAIVVAEERECEK